MTGMEGIEQSNPQVVDLAGSVSLPDTMMATADALDGGLRQFEESGEATVVAFEITTEHDAAALNALKQLLFSKAARMRAEV